MPRNWRDIRITSLKEYVELLNNGTIKDFFQNGGELVPSILPSQPTAELPRHDILTYVKGIEAFATPAYRDKMEEVWLKVMDDLVFMKMLTPKKNSIYDKDFNRQGVMRIVGMMADNKVFDVNKKELCKKLEPDDWKRYQSTMSKGHEDQKIVDRFKINILGIEP